MLKRKKEELWMKEERVTGKEKVHGNRWEEGARCRLIMEDARLEKQKGRKMKVREGDEGNKKGMREWKKGKRGKREETCIREAGRRRTISGKRR